MKTTYINLILIFILGDLIQVLENSFIKIFSCMLLKI